ncbi:pyrroline-5-carboxylate reductase [Bisporella sp. PMI_857]|nr:pyrroline-5-carboxylate reductase [Bisporella sp. PMI_857]
MAVTNGSTPRTGLTLAIIGCGVMGSAILQGVLESCEKTRSEGSDPKFTKFIACVNSEASVERLKARFEKYSDQVEILLKQNIKGANDADISMLGCKPYMVEDVLGEKGLAQALGKKLLISFVVGTPIEKMNRALYPNDYELDTKAKTHYEANDQHNKVSIVRGMMNIAAQYGESMTAIEDVPLPGDFLEITNWIFSQLGKTALVAPNLYDIGGVIAGASAGFMTVAIDGMLDGAVVEGIKRAEARKMLAQGLRSLAVLLENGDTPDTLREKFSSPRGTTIAGTTSLEADGVRAAYTKAVIKATNRSKNM